MWQAVRRELARLEWDVEPPLTLDLMADWTQTVSSLVTIRRALGPISTADPLALLATATTGAARTADVKPVLAPSLGAVSAALADAGARSLVVRDSAGVEEAFAALKPRLAWTGPTLPGLALPRMNAIRLRQTEATNRRKPQTEWRRDSQTVGSRAIIISDNDYLASLFRKYQQYLMVCVVSRLAFSECLP